MSGGRAPVSLRALEAFCAVARRGSVVDAARDLAVTASALSHLIRGLEERLGTKLVERDGRGIALTPEGLDLAGAVAPAMATIETALDGFRRRRTELRVSTLSTFATRWLIPRLTRFEALQPDIEVLVSTSTRLVDLRRESFDCAIRIGQGGWAGVVAERLYVEELVPACSPSLVGAAGLHRPPDLARTRLLHARSRKRDWAMWLGAVGLGNIDPGRGPVFDTRNLAIQAAIGRMGVAIVDPRFIAEEVAAGQLVVPFGPAVPLPTSCWLVSRPGQSGRPFTAFTAWLLAECGAGSELT